MSDIQLYRADCLIQYLSSESAILSDIDTPIPQGVLIYSKDLREFRMGINKRWSETPTFLSIADIDMMKNVALELDPRITDLELFRTNLIGSDNKIRPEFMPSLAITDTFTVGSQAAMLALVAQRGDFAIRTDVSETYVLAGDSPSVLANWVKLKTPIDSVLSVNGKTGTVVIGITDISGLQTALNSKQSTLISSENIKTINGQSVLGSGNIQINVPVTSVNTKTGDVIIGIADISNLQSSLDSKSNTSHNHDTVYYTKTQIDAYLTNKSDINHIHSIANITNLQTALDAKQATLISNTNIKTINGQSVLGSGDITISVPVTSVAGRTGDVTLGINDISSLSSSLSSKLPIAGGTMTGPIGSIRERVNDLGSASGALNLNLNPNNHFVITPSGAISIAFTGTPVDGSSTVVIEIIGNGTQYSVSWNAAIAWPDGLAPEIDWNIGHVNFIVVNTRNGGSKWSGDHKVIY